MVRINRIYTRQGDRGKTALIGGKKLSKDHIRVKAYGELDELCCVLGWARTKCVGKANADLQKKISKIQNKLFDIGAELATPPDRKAKYASLEASDISELEKWIDHVVLELPELHSFVLPGGSELNAILHLARAVCRRAERAIVNLSGKEKVNDLVLAYINRLSDALFAFARHALHSGKKREYLWQPKV